MALEWSETLSTMPGNLFTASMRLHRSKSRYWPQEADIREAADQLLAEDFRRRESMRGRLALSEFTRSEDEQCEYNAERARSILGMLSEKMAVRQ